MSSHLVTITERTYEESRTNLTSSQVSLSAMMLEDIKQVVRKDLKIKHGEGPTNEKMNEIISNYYVANQLSNKKTTSNQEEFDDIEEKTPPK